MRTQTTNNTWHKTITRCTILIGGMVLASQATTAQPAGVFPEGGSDMQVAQLRGDISQAETTVWNVDFSRHTIVKSDQISHIVDQYDSEGQLTM